MATKKALKRAQHLIGIRAEVRLFYDREKQEAAV
jgi:hypothetical protein